jgi:tetratricopeptide (TPR) repeat protein
MKKARFLFFCFVILSFSLNIYAAGAGTTSNNFIKLSQGARPAGMGEAFVGIADDVTATYWNAAGLAQLSRNQACLMHSSWMMDVNFEFLAYALPINGFGTLGIDATYLNAGDITKTEEDAFGNYLETNQTASASDFQVTLAYAKKFSDFLGQDNPFSDLSMGIGLNILSEKIYNDSGGAFSTNIGALYYPRYETYSVGFTAENIGMTTNRPQLPSIIKLGFGYRFAMENAMLPYTEEGKFTFIENNAAGAMDIVYDTVAQTARLHVGAEKYWELNKYHNIAVRLGYKFGEDLGMLAGLTAGLGYRLTASKDMTFELDYVLVPYAELGTSHRISITGKFNGVPEKHYFEDKKIALEYYKKGYELLYAKNFPEALSAFAESLKRNRNYAPSYMGIGACYLNTGRREIAMKAYAKAIEIDPSNTKLKNFIDQYKSQPQFPGAAQ